MAAPGGRAGDLLITVSIAPHPVFERDGADLRLDLPITLYEAVLGGKVRVPTLDGAVELAIPAGTKAAAPSASRARVSRPRAAAATSMATVRIVLPEGRDTSSKS